MFLGILALAFCWMVVWAVRDYGQVSKKVLVVLIFAGV